MKHVRGPYGQHLTLLIRSQKAEKDLDQRGEEETSGRWLRVPSSVQAPGTWRVNDEKSRFDSLDQPSQCFLTVLKVVIVLTKRFFLVIS